MSSDILRVPKTLKPVKLWAHPEGPVLGSMFVGEQSPNHAGPEDPFEVMNRDEAFVAVQRQEPDELRFYNRSSIIRVEYTGEINLPDNSAFSCRIQMMDGSMVEGTVREPLAPDRSRLFDYLNRLDHRFIRMSVDVDLIYLINKSYIVHATDISGQLD